MCGINGIIGKEPDELIAEKLATMNNAIIHRGPDDEGMHLYDHRVAMGMRRLSIIDLSGGHQPMYNSTGNVAIVFNGELYNFNELKDDLIKEGVTFTTHSDTEVVLKLYERYGTACLKLLNGMFAFAIHDVRKKVVFVARDRFGEKPLYYYPGKEQVVWASELKSITRILPGLKVISVEALTNFFALTYIPAPLTVYQEVFKLLPGHYLSIDTETLHLTATEYWNIDLETGTDPRISYEDAKAHIRRLLFESVEKRMIADVPLGVFLSGGVDSTIVAAIMAKVSGEKIQSFSVGYRNKTYDESGRARQVAEHIGADHHEYLLDYTELMDQVDRIVLNYDEPFADSSCIPTWFIADKTAGKVKVALTGDGGDEVFGGYNKYLSLQYRELYHRLVPVFLRNRIKTSALFNRLAGAGNTRSPGAKAKKFLDSVDENVINGHLNIIAMGFRQEEIDRLLQDGAMAAYRSSMKTRLGKLPADKADLKLLRYIDMHLSLEGDMLVKVDRASMLCSLECRAPFLDHRLMEFTYSLPDDYLLKGNNKKRILKDTFGDLLPEGFFNAPKAGFEIPVGDWFRGPLKNDLEKVLSAEQLDKHHLLNKQYVQQLMDEHVNYKADHSQKLWTLYSFQKWYDHNFQDGDRR